MIKQIALKVTLLTLVFINCKNKKNSLNATIKNDLNKNPTSKQIINEKKYIIGDSLISKLSFLKLINKSCVRNNGAISDTKDDRKKIKNNCDFFKIKYDYSPYRTLVKDTALFKKNDITYLLGKSRNRSESDDYNIINLYIEKNKTKIDSIVIFSYENFVEALVEKGNYFYFNNESIYVYNFFEDEEGIHSKKWTKYKIEESKIIKQLETFFED